MTQSSDLKFTGKTPRRRWRLSLAQFLGYTACASALMWSISQERPRDEKSLLIAGGVAWLLAFAARRGYGKTGVVVSAFAASLAAALLALWLKMSWLAVGWVSGLFLVVGLAATIVCQTIAILFRRLASPGDRKFTRGEKWFLGGVAIVSLGLVATIGLLNHHRPFSRPKLVATYRIPVMEAASKNFSTSYGVALSSDGKRAATYLPNSASVVLLDLAAGASQEAPGGLFGAPVAFSSDNQNLLLMEPANWPRHDGALLERSHLETACRFALHSLVDGKLIGEYDWERAWVSDDSSKLCLVRKLVSEGSSDGDEQSFRLDAIDLRNGEEVSSSRFSMPAEWRMSAISRDARIIEAYKLRNDNRFQSISIQKGYIDLGRGGKLFEGSQYISRQGTYPQREGIKWRSGWIRGPYGEATFQDMHNLRSGWFDEITFPAGRYRVTLGCPPATKLRWPLQIYEDRLPDSLQGLPFVAAGTKDSYEMSAVWIYHSAGETNPPRISWPVDASHAASAISLDKTTVAMLSYDNRIFVWKLPKLD